VVVLEDPVVDMEEADHVRVHPIVDMVIEVTMAIAVVTMVDVLVVDMVIAVVLAAAITVGSGAQ
jgi:hypothetical protein